MKDLIVERSSLRKQLLTNTIQLKQAYKSTLTASSEKPAHTTHPNHKPKAPPRNATQVFCNSLPASLLILLHYIYVRNPDYLYGLLSPDPGATAVYDPQYCLINPTSKTFQRSRNIAFPRSTTERILNTIPYAVLALYATAAADTFASELGIVATEDPILLTDLLRFRLARVPKGTNGGVTPLGVVASALGAAIVSSTFIATTPLCVRQWEDGSQIFLVLGVVVVGTLGALLDSVLGAWCQASVVDTASGKIIESSGGGKVTYTQLQGPYKVAGKEVGKVEEKREKLMGRDLLSNNGVNLVTGLLMAGTTILTVLSLAG